jgi:hypothetical protein
MYDATSMIMERFKNSDRTDSEMTIDAPIFFDDWKIIPGEYDIEDDDKYDSNNKSYALRAQDYGINDRISYYLEYSDPDKDEWKTMSYNDPVYELTSDTERVDHKLYYIKSVNDSGEDIYDLYKDELPATNNQTVYEKFGLYYADNAGKYRIRAEIRSGLNNYANTISDVAIFPKPIAPVLDTSKVISVILEPQEDNTYTTTLTAPIVGDLPVGEISYNWTDENGKSLS